MSKLIDIVGNKYNSLTVLDYLGKSMWLCLCGCGNRTKVDGNNLKNNHTTSCGCERIKAITKHGMAESPTYKSWEMMIQRCLNPEFDRYSYYGGRGIIVCDSWKVFTNFLSDMGIRPQEMSLDRFDVNGNYEKSNCRWVNNGEQAFNKRRLPANTSGRTGVYWNKNASKWMVEIGVDGKSVYLGLYSIFDDAVKCREVAEMKYYGYLKDVEAA